MIKNGHLDGVVQIFQTNSVDYKHNGRFAKLCPGDPGSNPGEDRYIIQFKLII